jgi:hypothetical protein
MNVVAISSMLNTAPIGAENPAPGCDPSLSFLTGAEKVYAANLIGDWQRQLQHLDGALPKTCKGCPRRSKFEPPRRPNIEPGVEADFESVGCG